MLAAAAGALLVSAGPAHAVPFEVLLLAQMPFGPFTPTETIIVSAEIINISDHVVYFCPGATTECVSDVADSYGFGGGISGPDPAGYIPEFGDGTNPDNPFAIPASLSPGASASFLFSEFIPTSVEAGTYGFDDQLQVFQASADRPMLQADNFGGTFQVADVPEPSALAALSVGLLGIGMMRRRRVG